ncbi:PREDICTED: LYR motif-containing protein 2 [Merops nubicus]|nr:PREDICTED: LYR motif-containing protein 2 [Merops nubicus]
MRGVFPCTKYECAAPGFGQRRSFQKRRWGAWQQTHTSLSASQFLRRQQVLQLYRKILRAIREVPAEADRRYLQDWAREEFRRNKDATEEDAIRMMITQGNMQLQELQRTLKLAKS